MDWIVDILTSALYIKQWHNDSKVNNNGELVLINFSMQAKSVSCFKQFITAYYAFHTKGLFHMSGSVYLLGFILQLLAITIHLIRKYKSWARTTIALVATLMVAGFFLLCRGMLIEEYHAWNTIAVPVIVIFAQSAEAVLLLRSQANEDEDDQHLCRNLVMKSAEVSINIYRWVKITAQTHKPLNAEKIIILVGGGLSVLIAFYQSVLILYKMGIMCKVVQFLGKIRRVFPGDEEQAPEPAMEVDEDDIVEKLEQEGVEVVITAPAAAAAAAAAAATAAAAAA